MPSTMDQLALPAVTLESLKVNSPVTYTWVTLSKLTLSEPLCPVFLVTTCPCRAVIRLR
jgi:hypothetical protein